MKRTHTLAAVLITASLVVLGALSRRDHPTEPPRACASPALDADLLRCDGEGVALGTRAWLVGGKLDLNDADEAALRRLPGVGPSLASAIVEDRAARGPFSSIGELQRVRGFGPKTVARLSPLVGIGASKTVP